MYKSLSSRSESVHLGTEFFLSFLCSSLKKETFHNDAVICYVQYQVVTGIIFSVSMASPFRQSESPIFPFAVSNVLQILRHSYQFHSNRLTYALSRRLTQPQLFWRK